MLNAGRREAGGESVQGHVAVATPLASKSCSAVARRRQGAPAKPVSLPFHSHFRITCCHPAHLFSLFLGRVQRRDCVWLDRVSHSSPLQRDDPGPVPGHA